jgi:spermidine/putrescine transport system substrate-binding protein
MTEELEGLLERRVDRKGFIYAGALAALTVAGGRLVDDAHAAADVEGLSGTLYYYNWADYVNPKTYDAFTKKTGVKVRKDFYPSNEALQAKLKAGARGYDLVVPTGYMVKVLVAEKLLQPINWSKLPNARANINPKFRHLPFDRQDRWSVAKDWGTTGFMYRTDLVKERPKSWRDVFALMKKHSRRFTVLDSSPEVIGAVAKMHGYSYNTESRSELDKVRDFLLDLKPHVHSFDSSTYKQKIVAGKAYGGIGWNGDGAYISSKKPAEYFVPSEGSEFWVDSYCIPVGARNVDAAHAWIDFVYDPKVNALETSYTYYGSPLQTRKLQGVLAKSILGNPDVFPPANLLKRLEANDISPAGTRLRERIWTEFKAA